MVNIGVTPELTEMLGVTVPKNMPYPAPLLPVPMAQWVTVPDPAVHAPKVMLAAGTTVLVEMVQPEDVRTTATRA